MESGKINCCITKDLSRLGRSAIDSGYYLEKYFPAKGIRFIAISDDYDSADAENGGIMLSLKNIVNEAFALDAGRKIRQTKQINIQKGLFVGRFPPYGYLKSEENRYKLVLDPYASSVVYQMFEMSTDGKSVREIANWLNSSGILPPIRHYHSLGLVTEKEVRGHIHWNKGSIYAILKNRVYCGDMVQGKCKTQSYIKTVQAKSEWIIVENTHEAIVNRELFFRVQKQLNNNNHKKRQSYSKNIFLSKIFCGHCGYTMRRNKYGRVQYNFKCETPKYYDKNDCIPVNISEDALKKILLDMLNKHTEVRSNQVSNQHTTNKLKLQKIQSEIRKNSNFFQTLYESLSQGDITLDEYRGMKSGYESKIAQLKETEKELLTITSTSHVQSIRKISDLTAEILDAYIGKILIFEDKKIDVQFKFEGNISQKGR